MCCCDYSLAWHRQLSPGIYSCFADACFQDWCCCSFLNINCYIFNKLFVLLSLYNFLISHAALNNHGMLSCLENLIH